MQVRELASGRSILNNDGPADSPALWYQIVSVLLQSYSRFTMADGGLINQNWTLLSSKTTTNKWSRDERLCISLPVPP